MAHQKSSTKTLTTKKPLPMTVRYFRKPGFHIPAKLIPVIVEELQSITGNATLRGAGDTKTAEQLVATAKPDSHPLHDWIYHRPAGEIAHEYYLNRAREAIRSVGVEIVIKNGMPPIRQRFVIYSQRADGYVPYTQVLTVKTLRQEDINHGLAELRLWLQRYGHYPELAAVVSAITKALKRAAAA